MTWETLGSALIGIAVGLAAVRLLPGRLPDRRLAVLTALTGALLGGLITGWVVVSGSPVVPLAAAALVSAATLSLLVRVPRRRRSPRPRIV